MYFASKSGWFKGLRVGRWAEGHFSIPESVELAREPKGDFRASLSGSGEDSGFSVQFSGSVASASLRPQGRQHARLPYVRREVLKFGPCFLTDQLCNF